MLSLLLLIRRRHPCSTCHRSSYTYRQRRRRRAHVTVAPLHHHRHRRLHPSCLDCRPHPSRRAGASRGQIEKKDSKGEDVVISIDPRRRPHLAPRPDRPQRRSIGPGVRRRRVGAASGPLSGASESASGASASVDEKGGIEIRLPPGADSEQVREAVEEARAAVVEAIRESPRPSRRPRKSARRRPQSRADEKVVRTVRRMRDRKFGDSLTDLALLIIIASAILKITYKRPHPGRGQGGRRDRDRRIGALKRQVVEARMAAMQAQVEPHFLFNTLASIDHLIETDPPRASQMQKNLIALLRASMPSMREAHRPRTTSAARWR